MADTRSINNRRFFRLDIPLHTHLMPSELSQMAEFYSPQATYLHTHLKRQLDIKQQEVEFWLHKVESDVELVKLLYKDILLRTGFFTGAIQSLEKGVSPFRLEEYADLFDQVKSENQHLEAYHDSAPKTYGFFKAIESKLRFYLAELHFLTRSSDRSHIVFRHLLFDKKLQADLNLQTLSSSKFDEFPLPRFIRAVSEYVNLILLPFVRWQRDAVLKRYPSKWLKDVVNLSEGGAALVLDRVLSPAKPVCFAFYPEWSQQVIGLKAYLVEPPAYCQNKQGYITKINFDMPTRNKQMTISRWLNQFEISSIYGGDSIAG
ncbi:hypothetical protein JX580_02155 [Thiomicrospira microaerophila]|uniref:hypothetical protein n=1 Tax=Thiomicrospira microaerophila TaxID=406020 RepID=UPI00200C092E|nr:hypothetical protein [Thiomicrospira microaerophila]UQB42722.1 hypothetical protein JX580_02155 [Thiomicrospira microaerophila]